MHDLAGDLSYRGDAVSRGCSRRSLREERQRGGDRRIDADVSETGRRIARNSGHSRAGQVAPPRIVVRYEDRRLRLAKELADSFIIYEYECLVLAERASEAAAELIAAEGRDGSIRGSGRAQRVEKVACIERAVSQELIRRAVEAVAARLGGGIDYRAVASELRAVCVGQRLEFGNGLHSKRGACRAGAGAVVKESRCIRIVEQKQLTLTS